MATFSALVQQAIKFNKTIAFTIQNTPPEADCKPYPYACLVAHHSGSDCQKFAFFRFPHPLWSI